MASVPVDDAPAPVQIAVIPAIGVCGIYFLWIGPVIVYVGKAQCVRRRVGQHLIEGQKQFDGLSFVAAPPQHIDRLETYFIRKYVPRYNKCQIAKDAKALADVGFKFEGRSPLRRRRRQAKGQVIVAA